jgi:hypothetical protein
VGDLLTETAAAQRLGVSKATLSRERLAGRIHPIRMGRRIIRYTDAILDEYRNRCPDNLDELLAMASECRTPLRRESGVYLLYLRDEVVYVGQTGNFISRLASHMFRKDFDAFSFLPAEADRVATLEARLIDRLHPRLNVALNVDNFTRRRTR